MTIFRSNDLPLGIEGAPAMGWQGPAEGGVEVHELPCYFTPGLSGPNVAILARELRACLDRGIEARAAGGGHAMTQTKETQCAFTRTS